MSKIYDNGIYREMTAEEIVKKEAEKKAYEAAHKQENSSETTIDALLARIEALQAQINELKGV